MSLYEDEDVDKHMNGAVEEKVRPHSGRNLRFATQKGGAGSCVSGERATRGWVHLETRVCMRAPHARNAWKTLSTHLEERSLGLGSHSLPMQQADHVFHLLG